MPASVAPSMPPSIQMPVADPMQRGSTQRCMTNGPLATMATKPRPSRARRASSMGAALANAEAKVARLARNAAPTMSLFAPTRPARPPTGRAATIPTSVNTDMSHEALPASIENSSMTRSMMVGIWYWITVTDSATSMSGNATRA